MKISRLNLIAFGPFTDISLDLSAGTQGLHIVYGPNEAGKSSALRAIHGLLFGIPTRCPDNHLHDYKKLRIGAVIENASHNSLEFVRRKASKGSILNPLHGQGAAFPDDVLQPFLGGVDVETFQRVYGIGHEELRRGGDDMQVLRGLVGESLFAATIGGVGLVETISRLEDEANELFSPTKRNTRIKLSEKHYKELQKQKRDARLSSNEWTKLQDDLRAAQQRRDEVVSQANELKTRVSKLQRIQQGLSVIGRRNQALQRLKELESVVVLPNTYDAAYRHTLESDLARHGERLAELDSLLSGPDKLSSQIEKLIIPDGLLEYGERIAELQDNRAVHVKAQKDVTMLRREVENALRRADNHLRELGLTISLDDVEQLRLTPDQRIKISALATDEKHLRDQPTALEQKITTEEISLKQARQRRDSIPTSHDVTLLQNTVDEILKMGDLQDAVHTANYALESATNHAENLLASLGLWSGTIEEALATTVPSSETLNRFSAQSESLHADKRLVINEAKRLERDLTKANESIAALTKTGHVPSEHELNQLRRSRDERWNAIRKSKSITPDNAIQFEEAVAEADHVADRLRRETERVTQLAQRHAEAESLQLQIERNQQQSIQLESQLSALEGEWKNQWSATNITEPLPPDEMRAWVSNFSEVQTAARTVAERAHELARHQSRLNDSRSRLLEALPKYSAERDEDVHTWSLGRLLDLAQELIAVEQANQARRIEADRDIEHLETTLDYLRHDLTEATKQLNAWYAEWTPAIKQLGMEASSTAEQANSRMEHLQTLFETVQEIEQKRIRIRDIEADSHSFESATERLSNRFLPDKNGLPADEIALILKNQLDQAARDQEQRQRLERQLQEVQDEATAKRKLIRDHQRQLDELLKMAGAKESSQLPQIEQDSAEKRAAQQRLVEFEEQLHDACGNTPLEDFVEEANRWDQDELAVEIAEIESALAKLATTRDEAVACLSDLQTRSDAADGSSRVAELDQESLGLIARMQRDAVLYMQRRLAHQMLRRQIEAHRAENEDPLLSRASTLFSRLTCEEFSGIKTDYDGDHPVIVGTRQSNGETVYVTGMSDGTRDQLYLALRLAYVEKQITTHEPMPFIVDDILVHFDDRRSQATLEVLAELSTKTQIIFFTHHIHLAELAKSRLPDDLLFVHHLSARTAVENTEVREPGTLFA